MFRPVQFIHGHALCSGELWCGPMNTLGIIMRDNGAGGGVYIVATSPQTSKSRKLVTIEDVGEVGVVGGLFESVAFAVS